MYTDNTFCSPNLNGFSPDPLVFGRMAKALIDLGTDLNVRISGTFEEHYELLKKWLDYLQTLISIKTSFEWRY